MDWSNETYVKVYTRETDDDLLLSWEALALWRAMLLKFDRSGIIATKRGLRGLSALVRIPLEVIERAMPELIEDGRLKVVDVGFFAPNYIAAQEAAKSDRQRQKESRDKRAREAANNSVTNRDQTSRAVTPSHMPSQPVTLCLADPIPEHASAAPPPPAVARDGYNPDDPRLRGALAETCWRELRERRIVIARELGLPEPLPLAVITPGTEPKGFRDLRDRIREEQALAPQTWTHVLEVLTAEARQTRSLEWLSEKSFSEGAWQRARVKVPTWRTRETTSEPSTFLLNGMEVKA